MLRIWFLVMFPICFIAGTTLVPQYLYAIDFPSILLVPSPEEPAAWVIRGLEFPASGVFQGASPGVTKDIIRRIDYSFESGQAAYAQASDPLSNPRGPITQIFADPDFIEGRFGEGAGSPDATEDSPLNPMSDPDFNPYAPGAGVPEETYPPDAIEQAPAPAPTPEVAQPPPPPPQPVAPPVPAPTPQVAQPPPPPLEPIAPPPPAPPPQPAATPQPVPRQPQPEPPAPDPTPAPPAQLAGEEDDLSPAIRRLRERLQLAPNSPRIRASLTTGSEFLAYAYAWLMALIGLGFTYIFADNLIGLGEQLDIVKLKLYNFKSKWMVKKLIGSLRLTMILYPFTTSILAGFFVPAVFSYAIFTVSALILGEFSAALLSGVTAIAGFIVFQIITVLFITPGRRITSANTKAEEYRVIYTQNEQLQRERDTLKAREAEAAREIRERRAREDAERRETRKREKEERKRQQQELKQDWDRRNLGTMERVREERQWKENRGEKVGWEDKLAEGIFTVIGLALKSLFRLIGRLFSGPRSIWEAHQEERRAVAEFKRSRGRRISQDDDDLNPE